MANIKALRKLKKWILSEPRRYNQCVWFDTEGQYVLAQTPPPCGTVACLAGNACLMDGYKPDRATSSHFERNKMGLRVSGPAPELARQILGLTPSQSGKLFNGDCEGWPKKAQRAYYSALTVEDRAKAAAMALDALIKKASR